MAEIEIGVMSGQCLDRRMRDQQVISTEVAAWEKQQNKEEANICWTFTVSDARVKLAKIYPSIEI